MGSKGGGFDAGPMLEYGEKALDLQKEIYEDGLSRTEPYYQGGTSALNTLLDYMGLQGGSIKSRDQWHDELKDQYTTQTQGGESGSLISYNGNVYDLASSEVPQSTDPFAMSGDQFRNLQSAYNNGSLEDLIGQVKGASVVGGFSQPTTTVDYDGLNAAIDSRMAGQAETPEGYGSLMEPFSAEKFQADPGYQFRLDEGNKAIERAAAARGQYYDPSTVKALTEHNAGMADQTYNQAFDRYNIENNNTFNRLASIAGIGQNANAQTISAGQNYANQAGNIYGQMGNAVTSANVANASQPSMFDTLINAGAQIAPYAMAMSDVRMKENIEHIGSERGFPTYKFNYKHDPEKTYIGVMAQDVEKSNPEAVTEINGIKHVNYGLLGVEMKEVV